MSETKFTSMLSRARKIGRAVGAFTCYNIEELEAVIMASEALRAPAIVLISPASFQSSGGERLVKGFRAMVDDASTELLLQLDHASDLRLFERAAACGVDAVMADGSRLPYEDNLSFTRSVVLSMSNRAIGVEAELGRVEGNEDEVGEATVGAMTEPDKAAEFNRESGADCLAVAIGNVHGHYSGTPSLDWSRLEAIQHRNVHTLSLHGASGLPGEDLRRAALLGISKFNVNTELRAAYFERLLEKLGPMSETLNLKVLGEELTKAVSEVVEQKLEAFGWTERR